MHWTEESSLCPPQTSPRLWSLGLAHHWPQSEKGEVVLSKWAATIEQRLSCSSANSSKDLWDNHVWATSLNKNYGILAHADIGCCDMLISWSIIHLSDKSYQARIAKLSNDSGASSACSPWWPLNMNFYSKLLSCQTGTRSPLIRNLSSVSLSAVSWPRAFCSSPKMLSEGPRNKLKIITKHV